MVFITHKVLNLVHSDTIACVLYELLVCRSLGFGIVFRDFPSRLRFHKFQYCSIFKVLLRYRVSVTACILYIRFSRLSRGFLKVFLKKFSSKNGVQAVGKGSSGCRRGLGSRDSLIIIASSMTFVNRFLQVFLIFSTKFEGEVWARCILG